MPHIEEPGIGVSLCWLNGLTDTSERKSLIHEAEIGLLKLLEHNRKHKNIQKNMIIIVKTVRMYSKNFTHMKNFFSIKCIVNHIDTHMNRKLLQLTIYRMNEACWFQCNKKYQQQCYSTRAFAKSPCYCSNNQYFGFFTLCNVNATEIMARDRDNIPRITKLTLWNHCCYSFLLTIIISCYRGTRKKQCQLIRKQLSYKGNRNSPAKVNPCRFRNQVNWCK